MTQFRRVSSYSRRRSPFLRSVRSLDVTKQALGQLFVHTLNVLLSSLVARQGRNNPCTLYFLNIGIDTTLGEFARLSRSADKTADDITN